MWKTIDLESLRFLAIWQIMWMPGIQQHKAEGIKSHVMRGTRKYMGMKIQREDEQGLDYRMSVQKR